jgi:hypothetical protein
MFEKAVFMMILGTNLDETSEQFKILHNEELRKSDMLLIRIMKSNSILWAGHATRTGRNKYRFVF